MKKPKFERSLHIQWITLLLLLFPVLAHTTEALPTLGLRNTGPSINQQFVENISCNRLKKVLEACLRGEEVSLNEIPEKGYSILLIGLFEKVNQTKLLSYLLAHGGKINAPVDEDKNTLLLWAAMMNNTNLLRYLIKRGAYVQSKNEAGLTALHWVSLHNNCSIVKLLISQGAAVNAKDKNDASPLHWAAQHNSVAVIRHLIKNKAVINSDVKNGINTDGTMTPLSAAIKHGNTRVVKMLLQNGAKIEKSNRFEEAICIAIRDNKQSLIQLLLNNGLKVKRIYLIQAVEKGYEGIVKDLLKFGGKPNIKNEKGELLLLTAIEKKDLPTVKALVVGGAEMNIEVNLKDREGEGLLHTAIAKAPEIALYFLTKGISPHNVKGSNYFTPLQCAVLYSDNPNLVKALLQHGANVHDKGGSNGSTALHCAMLVTNKEFMEILIQHGAKFDVKDQNEETPIQWGNGYAPAEQVAPFKSYASIKIAILKQNMR